MMLSNSNTHSRKLIGIDCRLSGLQHAGIGRYILNLISRLPSIDNDAHEWHYFFYDQKQWEELKKFCTLNNFELNNVTPHFVPIRHYTITEQINLPSFFYQTKLDLLHVPHFNIPIFYTGKLVTTIHDLLWHEFQGLTVTTLPAWKYLLKYQMYKFVTAKAVAKSQKIFVPAKEIKKTLLTYYPEVKNKITVTYEGSLAENIGSIITTYKSNEKKEKQIILLYIGSLYPHKNISFVLKALTKKANVSLWIVGSRNVFQDQVRDEIRNMKIENQVKFFGFVPDEKLGEIFGQVDALIQPSLSEGFGLTGIEAMSANLPLLASDIPIFREIYQDGANYFDPRSLEELIKVIEELKNSTLINQMIKRAKEISNQYSWDKMAKETFEGYIQSLSLS